MFLMITKDASYRKVLVVHVTCVNYLISILVEPWCTQSNSIYRDNNRSNGKYLQYMDTTLSESKNQEYLALNFQLSHLFSKERF